MKVGTSREQSLFKKKEESTTGGESIKLEVEEGWEGQLEIIFEAGWEGQLEIKVEVLVDEVEEGWEVEVLVDEVEEGWEGQLEIIFEAGWEGQLEIKFEVEVEVLLVDEIEVLFEAG